MSDCIIRMQLHKHRSYNHVELLFALAIPGNKPGRNFCIWVTSYIMGYIIYNAKMFSESCNPCSHLYCLLKKIPDLFFTKYISYILHLSAYKSSYTLPSSSCSSKKGWTLGRPEWWIQTQPGHSPVTCHCFSFLVSYILSDHLPLRGRDSDWPHLLYVLTSGPTDTGQEEWKILWLAASIIAMWLD